MFNEEDDDSRITPYNAFDILEACREAIPKLDEKVMLSWDNLAELNARMEMAGRYFNKLTQDNKQLRQELKETKIEVETLKIQIYPLLESVNNQLKSLVDKT